MFNSRQFQIVDLLINENASVAKISKIVQKSTRTVMRDIVLINDYFIAEDIGKIISSKESQGYKLIVEDNIKLNEFFKDWVQDEDVILFFLIMKQYVTIDELEEYLFLSKPIISKKLNAIKIEYNGKINICSKSHKGHFLNENESKRIILLSNLIEKNSDYFINKMEIKDDTYANIMRIIKAEEENINELYPNINYSQLRSLLVANYALYGKSGKEVNSGCLIEKIYKKSGCTCTDNMINNIEVLISERNKEQRKITTGKVLDILLNIEDKYETPIYDMELVEQLSYHIKRSIAYPYLLKQREIHNISNIKALYPFAFDLSILFLQKLKLDFQIDRADNDLVGLYFACSLERIKKSKFNILLLADQYSLANTNKQMIESRLMNICVDIIKTKDEINEKLKEKNISLIINNSSSLQINVDNIEIINVRQILSSEDIDNIEEFIEKLSIKRNIFTLFPKEYVFEYKVNKDEEWADIVENICKRLVEKEAINEEESTNIIEREKKENLLVINHVAIPHCISKRKHVCLCVYIHLTKTVKVENEDVNNVLVTCVNPDKQQNIKIFKYLYEILNEYDDKTFLEIKDYENFIKLIK